MKRKVAADCANFLRVQISRAPWHIRLGIIILACLFRAFVGFKQTLIPLRWIAPARLESLLEAFSNLGHPIFATFERLVRSMFIVAYLEHPLVLAAINEDLACLPAAISDPTGLVTAH
jgi:hypothetical protein